MNFIMTYKINKWINREKELIYFVYVYRFAAINIITISCKYALKIKNKKFIHHSDILPGNLYEPPRQFRGRTFSIEAPLTCISNSSHILNMSQNRSQV